MLLVKRKNKSKLIRICSFLLIILSLCIFSYKIIPSYNDKKNNEKKIKLFFEKQKEENNNKEEPNIDKKEKKNISVQDDYIGILEIEKINFKRGFYSIDSKLNNVNKNIEVIKESNMPNVINGNLIIAGHSGNASISYFRNIHKLEKGDIAKIYYLNKTYTYSLMNRYEIEKNGNRNLVISITIF